MRTKLLIFFLMLTLGVFSQKKQNWKNTFLYGFQLPDELENFSGIYLTIKYNGEPILPKSVKIGGKSIKIASEPFYLFDKSATIDHTKLPFEVPDHPVIEAKLEFLLQKGGNPFMDYSLPTAILKFKQGVGRLIRSRNDEGIICILDSRIIKKHYGRHFLSSLPECEVIIESDD